VLRPCRAAGRRGAAPPGDRTIGEFGFDFTRFGVRVPAVLVSPLIAPGTVYRTTQGRIDHTSVLKTIHERWGTDPLTQRDRTAASLGDVLTLAAARNDDPLDDVTIPFSTGHHPNASSPSKIDRLHAARVAALPIRNEKGHYEEASPVLTSAAELSDFIRDRTAAWKLHIQRQRQRRQAETPADAMAAKPVVTSAS
jgi:phospholipase C